MVQNINYFKITCQNMSKNGIDGHIKSQNAVITVRLTEA